MILFYTKSTMHLAHLLPYQPGNYISKQFSDGEWYVKINEEVAHKKVWVITATNPPADHLVELFLLLDTLQKSNAIIHLLFTYFGYARQDNPRIQEGSSAQIMGKFFSIFAIQKIIIIHAHSARLHEYLSFQNVIPFDLICQTALWYDSLAAPDRGAYQVVEALGKRCAIATVFLSKIRPEQEIVKILEYNGTIKAKKVLIIDDIIATGNTIIEVSKMLTALGAQYISVWATHGAFSTNAIHNIEQSTIRKIYVTNTLPQERNSTKIEVVNIAPFIETLLYRYELL